MYLCVNNNNNNTNVCHPACVCVLIMHSLSEDEITVCWHWSQFGSDCYCWQFIVLWSVYSRGFCDDLNVLQQCYFSRLSEVFLYLFIVIWYLAGVVCIPLIDISDTHCIFVSDQCLWTAYLHCCLHFFQCINCRYCDKMRLIEKVLSWKALCSVLANCFVVFGFILVSVPTMWTIDLHYWLIIINDLHFCLAQVVLYCGAQAAMSNECGTLSRHITEVVLQGVPRRQPHRCSGLATLPSVRAIR